MYNFFLTLLLSLYPASFREQFAWSIKEDAKDFSRDGVAATTKMSFLFNIFFGVLPAHRVAMMVHSSPEPEYVNWNALGRDIKQFLPRTILFATFFLLGSMLTGVFLYDSLQYSFCAWGIFLMLFGMKKIHCDYEMHALGHPLARQVAINFVLIVLAIYLFGSVWLLLNHITDVMNTATQNGSLPSPSSYKATTFYLAAFVIILVTFCLFSLPAAIVAAKIKPTSSMHVIFLLGAASALWVGAFTPLAQINHIKDGVVNGVILLIVFLLCARSFFFYLRRQGMRTFAFFLEKYSTYLAIAGIMIWSGWTFALTQDTIKSAKHLPYYGVKQAEYTLYDLAQEYDSVAQRVDAKSTDSTLWHDLDNLTLKRKAWQQGKLWHTFLYPSDISMTEKRYCFAKNKDKDDLTFCAKMSGENMVRGI